jgi:hypothetical protein
MFFQPIDEKITMDFINEFFSDKIFVFLCEGEVIHEDKLIKSLLVESPGQTTADEARGTGYYNHIFIHLLQR